MASAPEIKQKFHQVLCDMCQDKQTPALRTCLKCEISMCERHLQAHLTTPVLLQTHPLTKPTAPEGLRSGPVRCLEHGKLLEYYCMDDRTCLCVSCSIEGQHRLHNMKTLSSAHKVLVEDLSKELKYLAVRETQGQALKHWEIRQTKTIEVSGENLVKELATLPKIGLINVQNSVAARLRIIETARQNVEKALSEEDAHVFLQNYSGVHEAVERTRTVDFAQGMEKNTEKADVVSDLLKYGYEAMKNVKKLQRGLLVLVDPCKQHWGETKPTNVEFDPKSLGRNFCLSSDCKMLYCHSPKDITSIYDYESPIVFLQNDIKRADLSWAIRFSDKCDWCVGLCDKEVHNKPLKMYALEWNGKQMIKIKTEKDKKTQNKAEQFLGDASISSTSLTQFKSQNKLHIQWVHSSQILLFFIRGECGEMICLHSVNVEHYDQLRPFVRMDNRHNYSYDTSLHNSYLYRAQASHSTYGNRQYHEQPSQYVDFVCALDNDNLVAFYSHGQTTRDLDCDVVPNYLVEGTWSC